ncbi:MAG: Txe/YoeB family addiction module toxin [Acidobacteria bacterium]|nr:Txe/YoeB family addiction module toxin [Acidobacteriota bacterium]
MSPKPWMLKFSPRAGKDAEKLARAGLKKQAMKLLDILRVNPWQTPPKYEKLVGDLSGKYSRRINIRHRLVYEVLEREQIDGLPESFAGIVKVLSMWTHYE